MNNETYSRKSSKIKKIDPRPLKVNSCDILTAYLSLNWTMKIALIKNLIWKMYYVNLVIRVIANFTGRVKWKEVNLYNVSYHIFNH